MNNNYSLQEEPLVSIITPVYNHEEFIEDNIQSVKNQKYPNIEHIIVDGGSKDNTLEIIKKYDHTYNMRWISEKDEGQSDALNKGINMATGEIIGWLNSDDVLMYIDSIENIVKEFKSYKNADIVFGDIGFINREGIILRFYTYRKFNYNKAIQYRYNLGQPGVFFRGFILKKNKIRKDLHYVMDFELWLRLGKIYSFHHSSTIVSGFRVYAESKTTKEKDNGFLKERKEVLLEYESFEKKVSLLQKYIRGGYARLNGLIRMLLNLYIYKKQLAYNGKYLSLPFNIMFQALGNIDNT